MNKLTQLLLGLLICALVGTTIAVIINELLIPTTGTLTTIGVSVSWLNGDPVTEIDWGVTDNATEYELDPFNITSTSNVPITLTLSYNETVNIISMTLTWDYTDQILQPSEWIVVALRQNVTASALSYSYNTIIWGIGT